MAQSSALRKEELVPAPTPITINSQGAHPKDAQIANDGSVIFNASDAFWLYFSPAGVFDSPLGLNPGPNGPFYPQQQNVTVSYCITAPNTTCNPTTASPAAVTSIRADAPMTGGNTIKVG